MTVRSREIGANALKREGDEICRMVLQLVRSIARDPTVRRATPEPVPTSPVYLEYRALVDDTPRAS